MGTFQLYCLSCIKLSLTFYYYFNLSHVHSSSHIWEMYQNHQWNLNTNTGKLRKPGNFYYPLSPSLFHLFHSFHPYAKRNKFWFANIPKLKTSLQIKNIELLLRIRLIINPIFNIKNTQLVKWIWKIRSRNHI